MNSPVKLWRNQKKVHERVGKTGKIVSWTVIRVPPAGFADQAPYVVALIELADKRRIMAQIVDLDDVLLSRGLSVVTVVRRITQPSTDGIIPYGIKVKPL